MVAEETVCFPGWFLEASVANCSLVPGYKITRSFLGDEILDIGAEVLEFSKCHHVIALDYGRLTTERNM